MPNDDLVEAIRAERRDLTAPVSTRVSADELTRLKAVARRLEIKLGVLVRVALVRALPELEHAAIDQSARAGIRSVVA